MCAKYAWSHDRNTMTMTMTMNLFSENVHVNNIIFSDNHSVLGRRRGEEWVAGGIHTLCSIIMTSNQDKMNSS